MLVQDHLEKRVADLQAAVDQSAANHNMLLGHLNEVKFLLEQCKSEEEALKLKASEEGMEHAP